MSKPTETDFINAHLITDRILLRKLFEELRDRPQSKYFKNVVIKNVDCDVKKHFVITRFLSIFLLNFSKNILSILKCLSQV